MRPAFELWVHDSGHAVPSSWWAAVDGETRVGADGAAVGRISYELTSVPELTAITDVPAAVAGRKCAAW